ncbi:hypothetical protein C8R43DRAFT_1174670 [Mycena crocata]|nr:hypothetical protein C8R43DRAFT_1174670 [Mycena crocata]
MDSPSSAMLDSLRSSSPSPPPMYDPFPVAAQAVPGAPGYCVMIPATIPATIPLPSWRPPVYDFHGLPLSLLPQEIRSFLRDMGLDKLDKYSPSRVLKVRQKLQNDLVHRVEDVCVRIAYINLIYLDRLCAADSYGTSSAIEDVRLFLAELHARLMAYVGHADALVWVEITAREGSSRPFNTAEALQFRARQVQPTIDLIMAKIVLHYDAAAYTWMNSWRIALGYFQPFTCPSAPCPSSWSSPPLLSHDGGLVSSASTGATSPIPMSTHSLSPSHRRVDPIERPSTPVHGAPPPPTSLSPTLLSEGQFGRTISAPIVFPYPPTTFAFSPPTSPAKSDRAHGQFNSTHKSMAGVLLEGGGAEFAGF